MTFGHLTHTLSSNTVWDVRVGRFVFDRKDDPSTGSVTIGEPVRSRDGCLRAARHRPSADLRSFARPSKATVDHYRPELWGADHQWRIGGQFEKGEHQPVA